MITTRIPTSTSISAINAAVRIESNGAAVNCTCGDYLQDFTIHREGDSSKFFGFGISHKIDLNLIDLDRNINIAKGGKVRVKLGDGTYFDEPYPSMYISELTRNERTNNISCVAYDALYKANVITINEAIEKYGTFYKYPLPVMTLASMCGNALGVGRVAWVNPDASLTTYEFAEQPNFTGEEPLKVLLDAIAEFTNSIYYISSTDQLTFKRLAKDANPVLTVTKEMYFDLVTATPRTIYGFCHATELGDNLTAGGTLGVTQIMRDNPLYELNPDTASLLNDKYNTMGGLTIHQLECEWDGNHCLEPGDKVAFISEDDSTVITYIINDAIEYHGYLNEITSWEFTQDEEETASNPTNIGDKIKQTFAKVDKVNKEITLLAQGVANSLAEIKLTTDDITLRVEKVEKQEFDLDINNDTNFIDLKSRVGQLEVTENDIKLRVESLENQEFDLDVADDVNFKALQTRVGQLEVADTEITATVSSLQTDLRAAEEFGNKLQEDVVEINENLSELEIKDNSIIASVNTLETTLRAEMQAGDEALSGDILAVQENVSSLEVRAGEIEASVSTLESSTATNIANAVAGIDGNLKELKKELQDEFALADDALNDYVNDELVAVREDFASLRVETSGITATVSSLQKLTEQNSESLENEIAALMREVNLKVDSESVNITIEKALSAGVDKVVTTAKEYRFDDEGLNISSSDSAISTQITEDGMRVYKNNMEVLTADNKGVQARDLHARTFLIIGENSRLEDRGNRTACFWIGPAGG